MENTSIFRSFQLAEDLRVYPLEEGNGSELDRKYNHLGVFLFCWTKVQGLNTVEEFLHM
jgi:hypothetical protein